jgi:protein gp37
MTKIEWTDETWNPTRGCSRVSEGCRNCYAERQAARNFPGLKSPTTGESFAVLTDSGPHWTGKVELIESKLLEPLHWKKPRRVFVNSMSDLFHEALPDRDIAKVFEVMIAAERQTFQVLTKRPQRMLEFMTESNRSGRRVWPLPNVWLGVSFEDQPTADARIPELLRTPAAVRFVSYEPALAGVEWAPEWISARCPECRQQVKRGWTDCPMPDCDGHPKGGLDWIIVGGESGPGARPFDIEWARDTIRQCKAAGVPVFVKQLGARPGYHRKDGWRDIDLKDSKGGNWEEWPADLRIREFPADERTSRLDLSTQPPFNNQKAHR